MRPIWKDYNVNINGIEPYVHFYVRESGDTEILYEGRADRMPNDHMYNQLFICANKVCQTLLDVKYPSATGVTLHPEAAKKFEFIDSDTQSIVRGEADFIYDWSYEDIEYGSNILSEPINGHLDPRMRMFCTMYNSGNTAIEIDGEQPPIPPEPTFVLILSGNTSFSNLQQNSNIYVIECTDWSGVTITKSGSWFNYTKNSTGVTLSISENTTSSGRSGSLYFYHNGTLHTTLSLSQAASASPYEQQYFTYEALSSGTINLTFEDHSSGSTPLTVSYRKNGSNNWTTGTFGNTSISVDAGDKVEFKGENSAYYWGVTSGTSIRFVFNQFNTSAKCNIYGNIMSIVHGDNFIGNTGISINAFQSLIRGSVISAEHLVLPSTALKDGCYAYMFSSCSLLTTAPELPATTLAMNCYDRMFHGCTSLTTAPDLQATTLDYRCYWGMFQNCTSLTTAPALPATVLDYMCYGSMFSSCSSLVNAPALPATTLAYSCYSFMFEGCTSLVNAPALPATTLEGACYSGMFNGCTSLTTAPALPATTLADNCYMYMFRYCTSLTTAPELPATTLTQNCYYAMFINCSSLVNAPALPATTLAYDCYHSMFAFCTSLAAAPALPATTLADRCYSHMFNGCTSLTTAPDLPATTLKEYCYDEMFYHCTALNYVKCLAETFDTDSTLSWLEGVSATGTFVKKQGVTWETGARGIPNNWTVEEVA